MFNTNGGSGAKPPITTPLGTPGSSTPGGGLFGGATGASGGGGGLFGTGAGGPGGLFGGGANSGTSGTGGLFAKPVAGSSGGGGLFGGGTFGGAKPAAGTSGEGGLFGGGAKPAAGTSGAFGTGVLFGGGGAKSAAGTSGGGGLFGNGTSAVGGTKPASDGSSGAAGGTKPANTGVNFTSAGAPTGAPAVFLGPGNAGANEPKKPVVVLPSVNQPVNRQNGLHNRGSMRWMRDLAQLSHQQKRGAMAQNSNVPYFFSYLANRGSGQNQDLDHIVREKMHYDSGHLFRKIEAVRGDLVAEHSPMQHMFYRVAANQEVIPGNKERFIQQAQHGNYQQNPALTSPPDEQKLFWPYLNGALWEEALYKEKLADDVNLPLMPDPVQGLEQLSDYIKIKTGMEEVERNGQLAGGLNQSAQVSDLRLNVLSTLDIVDQSSDIFRTLKYKSEICADRIKFIKNRHYALRHRLTKVVGMVERLRKAGCPIDEEDSRFRNQMNSLAAELNDPNAARALLDDMQYQIQISHSVKQRHEEKLNDMNAARAHEFLSHQVNALTVLKKVLDKDLRDVQIMLDQKGQEPNFGTGNTPHRGW
jgi:hypothetical protein